jgi:hypothetical protein
MSGIVVVVVSEVLITSKTMDDGWRGEETKEQAKPYNQRKPSVCFAATKPKTPSGIAASPDTPELPNVTPSSTPLNPQKKKENKKHQI